MAPQSKKKAFVTGASSGIGLAIAQELASQGFDLVLVARRLDRLLQLQKELSGSVEVTVLDCDLADPWSIEFHLRQTPSAFTGVDLLVNSAGAGKGWGKTISADVDEIMKMIDINITGLIAITHSIVPGMIERKSGHIVNIGSVSGKWSGFANASYAASKSVVAGLTRSWQEEFGAHGIKCLCIEPGLVRTDLTSESVIRAMTPLEPGDVAKAVAWSVLGPKTLKVENIVLFPTDQYSVDWVYRRDADG